MWLRSTASSELEPHFLAERGLEEDGKTLVEPLAPLVRASGAPLHYIAQYIGHPLTASFWKQNVDGLDRVRNKDASHVSLLCVCVGVLWMFV